jgi:GNAT superfamily N-acetyltransferase
MNFSIRPMLLDDVPLLEQVYFDSDGVQRQEWERKLTAEFLTAHADLCFIALAQGKLIAGIFCGDTGARGMIHHLSVHPDFRRKGVGSALVAHVETAINTRGYRNAAVGIVREPYRDAFCQSIGFDPFVAPLMLQADLTPAARTSESSLATISSITAADFAAVVDLFAACESPRAGVIKEQLYTQKPHATRLQFLLRENEIVVAALLGECSGFRGLLLDLAVKPEWVDHPASLNLIAAYHTALQNVGVLRILAAEFPGDYSYRALLTQAGYIALEDERIALKHW